MVYIVKIVILDHRFHNFETLGITLVTKNFQLSFEHFSFRVVKGRFSMGAFSHEG